MKKFRFVLVGVLLILALPAWAQSVYLRAQSVATSRKSNNFNSQETAPHRGGGTVEISRSNSSNSRSENLKITLRNMDAAKQNYTVEWKFYAQNARSKEQRVHAEGNKALTLAAGETLAFDVESPALNEEVTRNTCPAGTVRTATGEKPAGFVVLAKASGRLLAVDGSDAALKKPFLDEMRNQRAPSTAAVSK